MTVNHSPYGTYNIIHLDSAYCDHVILTASGEDEEGVKAKNGGRDPIITGVY